jgi:hypothetical protein
MLLLMSLLVAQACMYVHIGARTDARYLFLHICYVLIFVLMFVCIVVTLYIITGLLLRDALNDT